VKRWFDFSVATVCEQREKAISVIPKINEQPEIPPIEECNDASVNFPSRRNSPPVSTLQTALSSNSSPLSTTFKQLEPIDVDQSLSLHNSDTNNISNAKPIHTDQGWSLSAKLNVFFAALFVAVLTLQWLHNKSLSSQMHDVRSELRSQHQLLEQALLKSQQVIDELIRRYE